MMFTHPFSAAVLTGSALFCSLLAGSLQAQTQTPAPAPAPETRKLLSGTPIQVQLTQGTNSNVFNTSAYAEVTAPVLASDGTVLIAAGTPIRLHEDKQRSRGVGRPGYVRLTLVSTRSVDGQMVELRGQAVREGRSRKGYAIGAAAGTCVGGCLAGSLIASSGTTTTTTNSNGTTTDDNPAALVGGCVQLLSPLGLLFLLTKGEPAYLPAGFSFQQTEVIGSYQVEVKK